MSNFDFKKKGAKVLVLSCIDPRFIDKLTNYLNNYKGVQNDYDLFNLAGAELGVLAKKPWRETFLEHIDIALKLHKIKKIFVFSHIDCGMYKVTYDMKEDDNHLLHKVNLDKVIENLKKLHPKLKYKRFLMIEKGIINLDGKVPKKLKADYDKMMGESNT